MYVQIFLNVVKKNTLSSLIPYWIITYYNNIIKRLFTKTKREKTFFFNDDVKAHINPSSNKMFINLFFNLNKFQIKIRKEKKN